MFLLTDFKREVHNTIYIKLLWLLLYQNYQSSLLKLRQNIKCKKWWKFKEKLTNPLLVGEGHGDDVAATWPVSWTRQSKAPHPSTVLGIYALPTVPTVGAIFKDIVVLRPSALCTWLNPVKDSIQIFKILAGRCGDLLVLQLPKASLLKPLPIHLEWSASFFGVFLPSVSMGASFRLHQGAPRLWANYQPASQKTAEMNLRKEAAIEEILRWPFTSMWGGVAPIPDVCGHPCDYRGKPKMPTAFMHLFEKLHVVHCGKEEKGMAVTVGWSPLWAVQPARMPN